MEFRFLIPDTKKKNPFLESLQKIEGIGVKRGLNERDTYELTSESEKSVTTVFITLQDQEHKSDIVFKSIRTQPKPGFSVSEVRNKGEGSALVQKVISWGHAQGFTIIIAQGVQLPEARDFWQKNGFVYRENPENVFEEWEYKP